MSIAEPNNTRTMLPLARLSIVKLPPPVEMTPLTRSPELVIVPAPMPVRLNAAPVPLTVPPRLLVRLIEPLERIASLPVIEPLLVTTLPLALSRKPLVTPSTEPPTRLVRVSAESLEMP